HVHGRGSAAAGGRGDRDRRDRSGAQRSRAHGDRAMTSLLVLALAPLVITETAYVEDVAVRADELWVATRGGVERYAGGARRVFTSRDGLAETWVHAISAGDEVVARTRRHECMLDGDRFRCEPAAVLPPPVPRVTGRY